MRAKLGFILLGLAAAHAAGGATIYVNWTNTPPGSGTLADPYTTITNAMAALAASNSVAQGGHTISVAAGMYSNQLDFTVAHSAPDGNPNTLLGNGEAIVWGKGIKLQDCTNMVIEGMTVDSAPGYGIDAHGTGSDNVLITNCVVRFAGTTGIFIDDDSRGARVVDCNIYGNLQDGIYFYRDGGTARAEHCNIWGNGQNGVSHYLPTTVYLNDCVLACNGGYGAREGHNQGDIIPRNCLFFGNGGPNFFSYEYSGGAIYNAYETAQDINDNTGGESNIVANPCFSDLANNWNFNAFYSDSPCLGAGRNGTDIGAHQGAPTTDPAARTFYVNRSAGDDGRDTATAQVPATPWASITNATRYALAGDTVIVAGGSYTGSVHVTRGGSLVPVTYRADGEVIVRGADYGLHLDRVAAVTVDGFTFTANTDAGVRESYACSNTVINGAVGFNSGSYGIDLFRSQDSLYRGMNIYSNGSCGIACRSESAGAQVDRCRVFGHTYGVSSTWDTFGRLPGRISNSDLFWNSSYAIHTHSGDGTVLENCVITKNGHGMYGGSGGGYTLAKNCIVADNNGIGLNEAHNQSNIDCVHCCFTNNPTANFVDADGAGSLFTAAQINALPGSTNNIVVNPEFLDAAALNHRVSDLSPCINAGTADTDLALDLYGNPRLQFGAVDIGSYELQPPEGTLIVLR